MQTEMTIFVNEDIRDRAEKYFQQHDASQYDGSLEQAQAEMQHWIDLGWASSSPTDAHTFEISAEYMQILIREEVIREED